MKNDVFAQPLLVLAVVILMIISAQMFSAFIPFLLGGLVDYRGFALAQASDVIGAGTGGTMLGSLLVLLKGHCWNKKILIRTAFTFLLIGNSAAMVSYSYPAMLISMFLVGLGSGLALSIGVAILAGYENPPRVFGMTMLVLTTINASTIYFIPVMTGRHGLNAIFFVMLFYLLLAIIVTVYLRRAYFQNLQAIITNSIDKTTGIYRFEAVLAIAATFFLFSAVASFLPFVERMAADAGVNSATIGKGFSLAMFAGGCAGVLASIIGDRYGYLKPLFVSCVLLFVGAIAVTSRLTEETALLLIPLFQFSYLFMVTFNNSSLAALDITGRVLVFGIFMETCGWFLGPLLAGQVLRAGGDYQTLMMLLLSAIVIFLGLKALSCWPKASRSSLLSKNG